MIWIRQQRKTVWL